MNQIIISIGREFGSGGHEIAKKISDNLNIPLYDKNLLEQIAKEKGLNIDEIKSYEEKPKKFFFSRKVNGYSNSIEDNLAQMEFDYLKEKANTGESFIIVGRCSDNILRGNKNLITIFIRANEDEKIKRLVSLKNISENDAKKEMAKNDNNRKRYHDMYSKLSWGDSKAYDLCINSSLLGIDGTISALMNFIESFKNSNK